MSKIKNYLFENRYSVLILLSVHFLISILIYFNTNLFYEISESGSNFDTYYILMNGGRILPIDGYYFLTPAFIAFFITSLTGNGLFYYFIFQIILSTITVFVLYKIILRSIKERSYIK